MDILIPDVWLRDYLKTRAAAKEIAKYLSLCGPSVEKIIDSPIGPVYQVEVTTNRVDCASVYGFAREAAAILPRFNLKAKVLPLPHSSVLLSKRVKYLSAEVDYHLCSRFTAVLLNNIHLQPSPKWLAQRLEAVGSRPINNVVDISNYIMHDLGQPIHTFDYDKIAKAKMILRKSNKNESITTLDGKTHTLPGGDIVIQDGSGKLIDLAGIMGGANSAIDNQTKNVLLFVQTYNPVNIRRTSMALAHRTEAAVLFEKGLDEKLVDPGLGTSLKLLSTLTKGTPQPKALDLYPHPYQTKTIKIQSDLVQKRIGITINQKDITTSLTALGFGLKWKGKTLETAVPSFRSRDINLPEDMIEEIARLYGYFRLPSTLMSGVIPPHPPNSQFSFETKVKNLLKGYGGTEVYTSSLVSREETTTAALNLKNPLGSESEYLRTSLKPSLIKAVSGNIGYTPTCHLFEMANVYFPRKDNLPQENLTLAGIMTNLPYPQAKGIIEALLNELSFKSTYLVEDEKGFLPNHHLVISANRARLGHFGLLETDNWIYYEFSLSQLYRQYSHTKAYHPISTFPPQVEDLTLIFPPKTYLGEVIRLIKQEKYISDLTLTKTYQNAYTFRVWFQNPTKTMTDQEVAAIRQNLLQKIKSKFGGELK